MTSGPAQRVTVCFARPLKRITVHAADAPSGAAASCPASPAALRLARLRDEAVQRAATRAVASSCLATIERTLREVPAQVDARLREVTALAVELGLTVAEEVVGAAIAAGRFDPTPVVLRCLEQATHAAGTAAADDEIVVHLAAEDHAVVTSELGNVRPGGVPSGVRFEPDSAAARGSVRVEVGAGELRWEPTAVVAAVAEAVREELSA